ncbi:hypothetical protein Rhopal_007485-T1 [Rhodotorula paludigena]|uniref:Impact N-terminal domain-containing protein n=1 Tax=Rhodotorula paludigena TaxID=86838 RepID=A0AAV5GWR7_9BASI|nr:hypothetical protein Rhopal_007485-T1 [Rhodotorula paludigena]
MSKRTSSAAFSSANEPSSKRTTTSGLSSYFPSLTGPPRPPAPLVSSDPLTDRQSTFIAHACPATNRTHAQTLQTHIRGLRTASHPCEMTHEMLAWRCLALKPGKSGLESEDDWRVETGQDDDGEKGGANVIRDVLAQEGGVDVAIVVSRLYGGVMLGPARFAHIRAVASQALARLLAAQRLSALRSQLSSLDEQIAAFSSSSAAAAGTTPAKSKQSTVDAYAALTEEKAQRLVAAREKRLELLEKKHREEEEALARADQAAREAERRGGAAAREEGTDENEAGTASPSLAGNGDEGNAEQAQPPTGPQDANGDGKDGVEDEDDEEALLREAEELARKEAEESQ